MALTDAPINNYAEASTLREVAHAEVQRLSAALNNYPRGPLGLTTDACKMTKEWKSHARGYHNAFQALREINSLIVKRFKKEYLAERDAKQKATLDNLNNSSPKRDKHDPI